MRIGTFLAALAVLALLPSGVAAKEEISYSFFDMTYLDSGMDGTVTALSESDRIDINIGDTSGVGLRMSMALNSNFHVFAGYSGSNMDMNATQTAPFPTLDQMSQAFFTSPGAANWDGLCDLNGDGAIDFVDLEILRFADDDTRVASRAVIDGDMDNWKFGFGYNALMTPKVSGFAQLFWDYRDLDLATVQFRGETRDFSASENGFGATAGLRGQVMERLELGGHVTYSPVGSIDMLAATSNDMIDNDMLYGIGAEYAFTDAFSICAEVEGNGDIRAWLIAARYQLGS